MSNKRAVVQCVALIVFNALANGLVSGAEGEWDERRGAAEAPAVRVMTYNIRCEGCDRNSPDNNWLARRDDLADLIVRENPDVAGFQEVEPGQLKWLAGRFADYTFVGVGRNADGRGEASPVAFRYRPQRRRCAREGDAPCDRQDEGVRRRLSDSLHRRPQLP